MIPDTHDHARGLDITELPTDEYPILSEAALAAIAHAAPEPIGPGTALTGATADPLKAALSLTHLEAEVTRLHAKWRDIDAEFAQREALTAQLREEIKAREQAIATLSSELELSKTARASAGEQLASKDVEIAALIREQHVRDEKIAALSKELADADGRHKEASEQLASAAAETARLTDLVLREQTACLSLGERNRQVLNEYQALQTKLQDLEIYINGRHDRWADLNTELASLKEALRVKEEAVEARIAIIAGHDEEKQQLTASIHALERQCAELAGRRKEREEAYDDLQKKLTSHLAQTEQLRAEHAGKSKETEQAVKRALDGQLAIESLERDVRQRDAKIQELTAEIAQNHSALAELAAAKTDLGKRTDGIEQQLTERDEQIRALRDDLRGAQDQQRRTQEHANELGKLHIEAVASARELQATLAARNELVVKLETELRGKQATVDLLERSVGRIADLGASVAALDERMNGAPPKRSSQLPAPPHAEIIDIGERTNIEAWRKLVVTIDGRTVDYPISKGQMTIGRGHESDIRVASHFISRVHAKIKTNGTATIIEDAGSKNGVLVNSERVLRRVLRNGDVVTLGDELSMRFVDATH